MLLLHFSAVFLLAVVVLVPLFQRLKLGGVLGYLAAGMLVGPWGFSLISETENVHTAAGLGGAQVFLTALVVGGLAALLGLSWQAAVVAGFGLAMSSTALVLSSLAERGQLGSNHGREAFAVLLFQDIAVIPLIALLPLLAYASVP